MAPLNLPSSLSRPFWDKQKAALAKVAKAPSTTLGDELAKLTKLQLALPWDAFSDDKLDSVEKAKARLAELEDAARSKAKALADQAQTVETVAGKFDAEAKKDAKFPKEPLVAAAAIGKAAREYRADIAEAVAAARKAIAARLAALESAQHKKAAAPTASGGGAESKAAKLVRTRGLDAIRRIRKPAPGAKPLRFLIVQGKTTVTTFMGPSVGPAQEKLLKSLIPTEAPYKAFKDPQAQLVWEKNAVTFVSDRLPAGLAKKMQLWLKKILKLNLKLRVRKTTGEVEESEGEDIPDDLLKPDPEEAAARLQAGKDYSKRLAALAPEILKILGGPATEFAAHLKGLVQEVKDHGKANAFEDASDTLDEIEAALEEGDTSGASPSAGTAASDDDAGGDAMAGWQAERTAAVTSLKAVAATIAAARHPSSTKALIEINGVMKNLTAQPATLQQVTELERWLGQDEVVKDVCELTQDIRTPLLRALGRLRTQLSA